MEYFDDALAHHGIKGQKWGVRRYQNYDGTRIQKSDMSLKKNTGVYRYSNKKESGSLEGAYAFRSKNDTFEYLSDAKNAQIGFKNYDKIYMTKISVLDDATVRRGADTVKDIVDKIGDVNVDKAYKTLLDIGYLDDSKSVYERYKLWKTNEETMNARNTLGGSINRYMYNKKTSKDTRDSQLDEYKKKGYDAIVDPEDFIWNYEMPLILLNDNKFKRASESLITDKSFKQFKEDASKAEKEHKRFYEISKEEAERVEKLKKSGGKGKCK